MAVGMEGRAENRIGALPRLQVAFLCTSGADRLGVIPYGSEHEVYRYTGIPWYTSLLTIVNRGKLA